ncbi:MAG: transglutaminase-like domain-containing protein [Desulfuromonadales bacterium]
MILSLRLVIAFSFLLCSGVASFAAPPKKIDRPPLSERWFGIYVDNERVGFYRQNISETPDGYRMDGYGSVRMKVMGFSKEASTRETYFVSKNLSLRSLDVEQAINGMPSRVTGKVGDGVMRLKSEADGKTTDRQLKFKGDVFPGPALNIYPLMRDPSAGKSYKILTFDPEELKVKDVTISMMGEGKTPEGLPALKLRNTLYPFVNNDILVDSQGNTLLESVRDGLVITKVEDAKQLGAFVGSVALAKKDLIYDFSLVRAEPSIKDPKKLVGLAVEIAGWNEAVPLLQDGGQTAEKLGEERITIRTGSLVQSATIQESGKPAEFYLKPADKIESDAPEIATRATSLAAGTKSPEELAGVLVSWTADWLKDTVDDGGGAVASFKSRTGNCQTHARLYTALARAAGIPTRFVSGLVYMEGRGFLYHSWAESFIGERWISIDPTYNQMPSDPTHLKLLEGHLPENMSPIIAIIGRIRITVLEARY